MQDDYVKMNKLTDMDEENQRQQNKDPVPRAGSTDNGLKDERQN